MMRKSKNQGPKDQGTKEEIIGSRTEEDQGHHAGIKKPKTLFALLALIFIIGLVTVFAIRPSSKTENRLDLKFEENKFKLSFQVNDDDSFSYILNSLGLPQNLKEGGEFELNSTPEAQLAFLTPVSTKFTKVGNNLRIEGTTSYEIASLREQKSLMVPQSTAISIYGKDFTNFLAINTSGIKQNIFSNIPKNGQFLLVTNSAKFALVFNQNDSEFQVLLDSLEGDQENLEYKEEIKDELKIHLFKPIKAENVPTVVLLNTSDMTIFTLDVDYAKEIRDAQSSGKEFNIESSVSFAIKLSNKEGNINENLTKLFIKNAQNPQIYEKVTKALNSTDEANFTLMGKKFSGLINFK